MTYYQSLLLTLLEDRQSSVPKLGGGSPKDIHQQTLQSFKEIDLKLAGEVDSPQQTSHRPD